MLLCTFCILHIECKMAVADCFHFIRLEKLFARVLANGLQTTIPNLASGFFNVDEGFIHQSREQIEDIDPNASLTTNCFSIFERPATDKDCQPAKQRFFWLRKQAITPIDQGAQSLL